MADPHFLASTGASAAGYLVVRNQSDRPDRLVGVSSPRGAAELHDMVMDGGMMSMRRAEAFDIPAGGALALERGGKHIMLIGLTGGLAAGEVVPVTLTFENAGEVTVDFPVKAPTSDSGGHGAH